MLHQAEGLDGQVQLRWAYTLVGYKGDGVAGEAQRWLALFQCWI